MIAHFRAVMNTGTVPAKLKELRSCVPRSSITAPIDWPPTPPCKAARLERGADQRIGELPRRTDFTTPRRPLWNWPNGLRSTQWLTTRSGTSCVSTSTKANRRVAAAIGLFNYFNRFNNALHMEPTSSFELRAAELPRTIIGT